ncbi:NUDIX hydrolase [Rhizobium sp. CG5]|uniref:NUDIX hydrolase n=1 Tax=Rhizobium sp. CG5 TaxID=2726076 RepID=UPI0020343943|nr:NUDIX hydrolase [Rhizobium sp. CG5]MCM2476800.1 NUDIX hydrolase [Rhizobium sp. CG5]
MPDDKVRSSAFSKLAQVTEQILKGNVGEQYAAICIRKNSQSDDDIELLLVTSRDSGRWVIPKGWGLPKKKPHEVAAREAWEEAGVTGKVKKKPVGYYTYVKKVRVGEHVPSLVQVHLLRVTKLDDDYPESGQRKSRWFSPEEAAASVDEPELATLLIRTRHFFGKV